MAAIKSVQISNVWEKVNFDRPRNRIVLAEEEGDIRQALNCYSPGDMNEMHYHVGSGQSFLVLKGPVTMRHRHKDQPKEENQEVTLNEGDCILIPADVYYQMLCSSDDTAVLYQVKQADDSEIAVEGKGVQKSSEYFTAKRQSVQVAGDVK
jgi:quercetin dioxygenase-like cupin family protein